MSRIAREAYVSGLHLSAIVAGCVVLLASGIVYRKLPAGNPHAAGRRRPLIGPRPDQRQLPTRECRVRT